jgi:DNA repair protein RadC
VADLVARRPDIELSQHLKDALAETEIYLLDHFLVSGDSLSACRPK